MKKRLLSFLLSLLMLAAMVPALPAAAADTGVVRVITYYMEIGATYNINTREYGITVCFKRSDGNAPETVQAAMVPAGTDPANAPSVSKLPLSLGYIDYAGPESAVTYGCPQPADLSGDYNLWIYVDDLAPVTNNRCYRILDGIIYSRLAGLNPAREYAEADWYSLNATSFWVYCYTDSPVTLKMVKKDADPSAATDGTVTYTAANRYTYTVPAGNHTGIYTVWYSMDDGPWRGLTDLVLLAGKIHGRLRPPGSVRSKARLVSAFGDILENGTITATIHVSNEVFMQPEKVTITDIHDSDNVITSMTAFTDAGTSPNVTLDYRGDGAAKYTFVFSGLTLSDDGIYVMTATLGGYSLECMRIEVFKGVLYRLAPGEILLEPSSMDDNGAWNDERFRIFLGVEYVTFPAAPIESYSTDGGKKWNSVKSFPRNLSKQFNGGFELWLSNESIDKKTKKPADGAKYIKFPKIGARGPALKLEVNYQLAHMQNGALVFEPEDENFWVAVQKGTTKVVGDGLVYRMEGFRETNNGDDRPSGKMDIVMGMFDLPAYGLPVHEGEEKESSSETSERISYKQIKSSYFVSTAPYFKAETGVYYPASKPAKLTVSCYGKPPAIKANYKTETLKLAAGIVLDDKRLAKGIVTKDAAKKPVDISALIDEEVEVCYQVAPTAKKPASCCVFWFPAPRNEGDDLRPVSKDGYEIAVLEYGKFKVSKDIEFRTPGAAKWGGFKAPKSGSARYEFRYKATAKGGKLLYEGGDFWYIDDSFVIKREDEYEVYAVGRPQSFFYNWGKFTNKSGKEKTGITGTSLT